MTFPDRMNPVSSYLSCFYSFVKFGFRKKKSFYTIIQTFHQKKKSFSKKKHSTHRLRVSENSTTTLCITSCSSPLFTGTMADTYDSSKSANRRSKIFRDSRMRSVYSGIGFKHCALQKLITLHKVIT